MKYIKSIIISNMILIVVLIGFFIKESYFSWVVMQELSKKYWMLDTFILVFMYCLLNLGLTKRNLMRVIFTLMVFLSILMFGNVVFYRAYGDLLTIGLLAQAGQVTAVGGSIFMLLAWSDLLLVLDLPFLYYWFFKTNPPHKRRVSQQLLGLGLASVLIISFCSVILIRRPNLIRQNFSRRTLYENYGIIGMYLIDNYNFISNNVIMSPISSTEEKLVTQYLNRIDSTNQPNKTLNLIVIQVESLQDLVIGRQYNGKEITPNINALVKESLYFDHVYYHFGLGHTADVELSVNTGLFPMDDAAAHITKYNNEYNALPDHFRSIGYQTIAFHGNSGDFWNRNQVFQQYGFNEFYDLNRFQQDEIIELGLSDKSFFQQSAEVLINESSPFYAFLISVTSHSPFIVEHDFSDQSSKLAKYYNAINYTDQHLGVFIDKLATAGVLDNSILVVYGDHNGITYDMVEELSASVNLPLDKSYAWQSLQRVPLIIRYPNQSKVGYFDNSVGQVDIHATLAEMFNLSGLTSFGNSVLDGADQLVVLRNGSYVLGDVFYDSKLKQTFNMLTGEQLANNQQLIEQAFNQLKASNLIFKYDYLKKLIK